MSMCVMAKEGLTASPSGCEMGVDGGVAEEELGGSIGVLFNDGLCFNFQATRQAVVFLHKEGMSNTGFGL